MKEAPSPRMLKWTAISLGVMLLGMLMISGLLLVKKINEKKEACNSPVALTYKSSGNLISVSDEGKSFLVTLENNAKSNYILIYLDKCTGNETSRIQLNQSE